MNPSNMVIAQNVIAIINDIAAKLGIAVDKIYPYLMKQAEFEAKKAYFWVVFAAIVCTITLIVFIATQIMDKMNKLESSESYWFWTIASALFFGIFLCVGITFYLDLLQLQTNPEWYIYQKIMEQLQTRR